MTNPDPQADTARTETRVIEGDIGPAAVFELLNDPSRIPEWAPDFADSVIPSAGTGWTASKAGQAFAFDVEATRTTLTVDYLREIAPGQKAGAYVRVLPRPGGGAVVIMTVPVAPGLERAAVAATLDRELRALIRQADGAGLGFSSGRT